MEIYRCPMLEKEGNNKMATYKERVAALKEAGKETKRKHAEAKAKRKAAKAKKKAAKKPVSVVKTKGGDYPVYKKESKKAESFRSKFAKSRKAGKKTFTWKGKSYSTKTADDVKKEKAAKAPKKVAKKVEKKKVVAKPKEKVVAKEWHPPMADSRQDLKPKAPKKAAPKKRKPGEFPKIKPYPPREDQGPKFAEGGKVESNPYGWPSTDARGKK